MRPSLFNGATAMARIGSPFREVAVEMSLWSRTVNRSSGTVCDCEIPADRQSKMEKAKGGTPGRTSVFRAARALQHGCEADGYQAGAGNAATQSTA